MIAIERDVRALGALAEIAAHWPGRLEIIEGDALRIAPETLIVKAGAMPIRIVANLPYNVATALLAGWLEAEPWPPFYDRLTLMFQREVAGALSRPRPSGRITDGSRCWRDGGRRRASCSTSRPPLSSRAKSHVERGRTHAAREPGPLRHGDAGGAHPGRVRPAAQDAAPVAKGLRRGARHRPSALLASATRADHAGGGGRCRGVRDAGAGDAGPEANANN